MDKGDIYAQRSTPIDPDESFGTLYERLSLLGRAMLRDTLPKLLDGSAIATSQPTGADLPYAHKITKENSRIKWDLPARCVHNFVRSLSPLPSAWTMLKWNDGGAPLSIKVLATECHDNGNVQLPPPGTLILDEKGVIKVACRSGFVRILRLQAAGKKAMSARDFLNGMALSTGFFE